MKNRFYIFLISLFFISSTQLKELLKLPVLINHYMEHLDENSNLSVYDFLKIHYADGVKYDEDYNVDMKLPFKNIVSNNIVFNNYFKATDEFNLSNFSIKIEIIISMSLV